MRGLVIVNLGLWRAQRMKGARPIGGDMLKMSEAAGWELVARCRVHSFWIRPNK